MPVYTGSEAAVQAPILDRRALEKKSSAWNRGICLGRVILPSPVLHLLRRAEISRHFQRRNPLCQVRRGCSLCCPKNSTTCSQI